MEFFSRIFSIHVGETQNPQVQPPVTPLTLTDAEGVGVVILTPNLWKLRQGEVEYSFPELHSW